MPIRLARVLARAAAKPLDTRSTRGDVMKVGDLVKYRTTNDWLGLIVREIPGNNEVKIVEWWHREGGRDRGGYRPRDLELVSESR